MTEPAANINFQWGTGSPDPLVRSDNFSSIFTGRIQAPTTGVFTFLSNTDDDGFLFVNGQLVSRDPGSHGQRNPSSGLLTPISLTAGVNYDFAMYERDSGSGAGATMLWSTPPAVAGGTPSPVQVIPPSAFVDPFMDSPSTPSGLSATSPNPFSVNLRWTGDLANATRYRIYRSTDGTNFAPLSDSGFVFGTGTSVANVPTTFTDASVHPGTQYWYRVQAMNFDSESDQSNMVTTVTPTLSGTEIGVETHFYNQHLWQGTPQAGLILPNIASSWASGQAPQPQIQNHDFSTIFSGKLQITSAGTYTFRANTDDDGYLYVDGALASLNPGSHSTSVLGVSTPLFLSAGSHDIVLKQNQDGAGSGAFMFYSGPDTAGVMKVAPSTVLKPVSDAPAAPTGLTAANVTSDSVSLQWQDNSISEIDYLIERSSDGVNFSLVGHTGVVANPTPGSAGVGTFVDSVDPDSHYVYRVRAVNFDGDAASDTTDVDTPARTTTDIDYTGGFVSGPQLLLNGFKNTDFASPNPNSPPNLNSPPQITADGKLELTDNQTGEARTAYTTARVPVDIFSTSFVYQANFTSPPTDATNPSLLGDGMTFVIQNYNPSVFNFADAMSGGVDGGNLGYSRTPRSIAVKLDLFQNSGGDPVGTSTGVFTSGSTPIGGQGLQSAGIDLRSGDPIAVSISYRGDTQILQTQLVDTVTGATFTGSVSYDIPALIGGQWAYVGFAASDGGGHSTQTVSNWQYSGRLGPTQVTTPPVTATYGQNTTDLSGTLSFGAALAGETLDFNVNGIDIGTAITGSNGIATLTTSALSSLDVGTYGLTVSFAGDSFYTPSSASSSVQISPAPAAVQLVSPPMVTASKTGDVTLQLQAVVADFTGGAGDIRNATLSFEVVDPTGATFNIPGSQVSLINPDDNQTGTSSATFTTNLNGATSADYQVFVFVSGDYDGSANSLVSAAMPAIGHASGGGQLAEENSAGLYAADVGSILNFSLMGKDMNGTAGGSVSFTFLHTVADGRVHIYQVQSTSITSYGANVATGQADIAAVATLSDITDPNNAIVIASGLQLDLTLTDRGSPGVNDSLAISVWNNGQLYFSSDWSGLGTNEDFLKSGNLVVH